MIDSKSMQGVIDYFNQVAKSTDVGFSVYHESFRNPTLEGACNATDPLVALKSSLIVEGMRQRRTKLIKVWNSASKQKRARNKKAFEILKDEIGALSIIIGEYS